jgi:hypothetical protein
MANRRFKVAAAARLFGGAQALVDATALSSTGLLH